MRIMLDTNVCNALCDGHNAVETFIAGKSLWVTSAQMSEIEACSEPRRARLLVIASQLNPSETSLKSALWGHFNWDEMPWGADGGHYETLKSKLDEIKRNDRGNVNDALIAEVCIIEKMMLVTCDNGLAGVLNRYCENQAILFPYSSELRNFNANP